MPDPVDDRGDGDLVRTAELVHRIREPIPAVVDPCRECITYRFQVVVADLESLRRLGLA